ncbi:hypothetical protein [uncultured Helicobacter sp.]|uniref:hypothetical protein n=1 Tax=uncultured Helicobacter sp. TaxID=175537 RepID=UPI00262093B4|nr:hypothetical protein [uncultured Helicobacter sp.]
MLILNHSLITPLNLVFIKEKTEIKNSLPNDFLILENNDSITKLAKYCKDNHLDFSAIPTNITEALLLVNLNARHLLTDNLEFASTLQKLAEIYLFDTKILLIITQETEIETAAKHSIDGVIFIPRSK